MLLYILAALTLCTVAGGLSLFLALISGLAVVLFPIDTSLSLLGAGGLSVFLLNDITPD